MRYLLLSLNVLVACSYASAPAGEGAVTEQRWLSATIPPQEGILGRVVSHGRVRLLTTGHRIVALDVSRQRVDAVPLRDVAEDENLTGFGSLPDGSLWTLSGWTTLLRVSEYGDVVERRSLGERQTGLHSGFDRLVYQPLDFTPGVPALVAGPPGVGERTPWGTLRVREGRERGPVRLAQSLAACGVPVQQRIPCWLSNAAAVELVDQNGHGSTVEVQALATWPISDPVAFANNPHRVIRDVWLRSSTSMWILVRPASSDRPDRRGERGLWQVSDSGAVTARYLLPSRARLIVGVEPGRIFLLTSEGHVVSVEV